MFFYFIEVVSAIDSLSNAFFPSSNSYTCHRSLQHVSACDSETFPPHEEELTEKRVSFGSFFSDHER